MGFHPTPLPLAFGSLNEIQPPFIEATMGRKSSKSEKQADIISQTIWGSLYIWYGFKSIDTFDWSNDFGGSFIQFCITAGMFTVSFFMLSGITSFFLGGILKFFNGEP